MTDECTDHHFASDGRCWFCGIQARYYAEAMVTLSRWSKKEKTDPTEQWQEMVDSLKCKPHFHDPHHGIITPEEHLKIHNPFYALYDMEHE